MNQIKNPGGKQEQVIIATKLIVRKSSDRKR
jgi:hypothetical protein